MNPWAESEPVHKGSSENSGSAVTLRARAGVPRGMTMYLIAFVAFGEHVAPSLIASAALVTAKSAAGKTAAPAEAEIVNACGRFGCD